MLCEQFPTTLSFRSDITETAEEESRDLSTSVIPRHSSSLSPAVRFLIETYGLNFFKIDGSGPHGRVLKGDVLCYMNKAGIEIKPLNLLPTKNVNSSGKNDVLFYNQNFSLKMRKPENKST